MPIFKGLLRVAATGGALVGAPLHAWADPTYTVIHHFTGQAGGGEPDLLIGHQAVAGVPSSFSLFGETRYGGGAKGGAACQGNWGCGVIFQLTPPPSGAPAWAWTETNLYPFQGYEGALPIGGLVLDSSGAIYGTTATTLPYAYPDVGAVFRLTPPPPGQGYFWYYTNLSKVGYTEGVSNPGHLIMGSDGSLYAVGSASIGSSEMAAIYRFTPPAFGKGAWSKSLLYTFADGVDYDGPVGSLVLGPTGTLYGATYSGGVAGRGSVFSLSPPDPGKTKWTFTTLYSFYQNSKESDGFYPAAGLIQDKDGALYGTTELGGSGNFGTVFKLTPAALGQTTWTKTTLCSFDATSTGASPWSTLVADGSGALYGVAVTGTHYAQYGEVFRVTPPATGKTAWTLTTLHNFGGPPYDGWVDYGGDGLTTDPSGNVYGTTLVGGIYGYGVVFKITP